MFISLDEFVITYELQQVSRWICLSLRVEVLVISDTHPKRVCDLACECY